MILDHINYIEDVDVKTGKIAIRATYRIINDYLCDIHEGQEIKDEIKVKLAKSIQEQMIKDLSGYFHDSFTDEDIIFETIVSTTSKMLLHILRETQKL